VPDQLLNLLKLFLLLLLYLFFFRVVRAVWAEMAPLGRPEQAPATPARKTRPRTTKRGRSGRSSEPGLTALAPPELKGRTFPLSDEVTVGRAAGCQVTLEDSYASQLHARVFARDGQWYVEDLGSTNGTYLNRRKVTAPMVVQRGDKLQIGNTVLEMR
jgi:pSer/pThr/pTyr-binding forkhead associated (FHA) protein